MIQIQNQGNIIQIGMQLNQIVEKQDLLVRQRMNLIIWWS